MLEPKRLRAGTDSFDETLDEHLAALHARDIERFATTLSRSADICVVGPGGDLTRGFADVYEAHRMWFESPARWTFDSRELWRKSNGSAGLAVHEVTYRSNVGQPPVRFMLSFGFVCEEDHAWRLIFNQNTPLEC